MSERTAFWATMILFGGGALLTVGGIIIWVAYKAIMWGISG